MTDLMNKLAAVVAAASLAITLVAAGFAACAAFPQTTEMLAGAFSGNGNPGTPFSHDELVQAAVATRDYTVGSNDREAVFSMLHAINESAGTPYAEASPDELAAAPEEYTLPADALSHLDDVYHVVAGARIGLIVVALVAVAACAHMAVRVGRRALGGVAHGHRGVRASGRMGDRGLQQLLRRLPLAVLRERHMDVLLRLAAHHHVPARVLDRDGGGVARCDGLAVHRIHRRRRLAAPQTGVGRPSHLRSRAEPTRI